MLVVISDLHFAEEKSDTIPGSNGHSEVRLERNLPGAAFQQVFADLAADAERNGAQRLDLVLAGDVFDLYRTQLWAHTHVRPYEPCGALPQQVEAALLDLLDSISNEKRVAESLAAIRLLAQGKYVRKAGASSSEELFPVPVTVHFIPGNHDRLANGSDALRSKVRALLGMPASTARFPQVFDCSDPRVLVRHGHEYDRYNFANDYSASDDTPLPTSFPQQHYDAPSFGDYLTIDVAARLPWLFRQHHGDANIVASPTLSSIYRRLLEFDDVRPQSALLDFLLDIPGSGLDEQAIWDQLEPIARTLLDELAASPLLNHWLKHLDHPWHADIIDVFQGLLASHVWKLGLPLKLIKPVASMFRGNRKGERPEDFASREPSIRSASRRFLIAGHTHAPQVVTLSTVAGFDRFYVDTGTWRHQLRQSSSNDSFGRVKALTYVAVYASDEDPRDVQKTESFDYWTGVTQRWMG